MLISLKLTDRLFLSLPVRNGATALTSPCWERWDIQFFAEIFTRQGFEVEAHVRRGEGLEKVVVGRIESAERHPKADKLQVCQVRVAPDETRQIVCGAANARSGLFVAVALPGAKLPNGLEIKNSKIRDVDSAGMLCSREELGLPVELERDGSGIWELHHEPSCGISESKLAEKFGQPVFEALGLDDVLFELNVTPNRPDLLGHEGAARELCAGLNWSGKAGVHELKPWLPDASIEISAEQIMSEAQERTQLETRSGVFSAVNELGAPTFFVGLDDVSVANTPAWMRNALEALGQRSINSVVDAGNLILLCFAQPNHAFDLAKLKTSEGVRRQLTLRFARNSEEFIGLDGKERRLADSDCVVADSSDVQALLGVIGGEKSKVTSESTSLVLEFACPHPVLVRRTSRRHGRKTDSSFAFEKGIDVFRRAEAAQKLVSLLSMLQFSNGTGRPKYVGATAARPAAKIPQAARSFFPDADNSVRLIDTRNARPDLMFSMEFRSDDLPVRVGAELVPFASQLSILSSLGFKVTHSGNSPVANVVVPTWRRLDVAGKADLVEEIVRVVGIDNIPALPMQSAGHLVADDDHLELFERAANRMVSLGYHETAGFHFMRADDWKKLNHTDLNACGEPVALMNPIIKDEPLMQTTLLSGLLRKVSFNLNYGNTRGQIFEISRTFQNTSQLGQRVFADNGSAIELAIALKNASQIRELFEYAPSLALSLSREKTAAERPGETPRLCGVVFGAEEEKQWLNTAERAWTLHGVAAHVAELVAVFGLTIDICEVPAMHPMKSTLHPGRSAHVFAVHGEQRMPIGWVAQFHPAVLRHFEIEGMCLGFEVNLSSLHMMRNQVLQSQSESAQRKPGMPAQQIRLPTVERDFAFLVDESLTAERLVKSVRTAITLDALEALKIPARLLAIKIFDIYRGQGVSAGQKSVALRVTLLPTERTLVDADITAVTRATVSRVTSECGAQLRG